MSWMDANKELNTNAVVECARRRWEEVARIVEKAGEEPQTLLRAMGAIGAE